MGTSRLIVNLLVCVGLLLPCLGNAQPAGTQSASVKLHDLDLWDQEGKKVRFVSEVIGDKVVAIVPFYTTCTTAYPILIFTFSKLQEMLGDRLGKEVVLISLSVDPRTDIPQRLKAFARKQKARPGWVFLSGEMGNLAKVVTGIGVQYIVGQSLDDHSHIPLTLVGTAEGSWRRLHGYPSPEMLKRQIEEALSSRPVGENRP
jgi:protein SCO1/2